MLGRRYGGRGRLRPNSKSERIVVLRMQGKSFAQIAAEVGTSANSCRVLFWKRKHITQQLLSDDVDAEIE